MQITDVEQLQEQFDGDSDCEEPSDFSSDCNGNEFCVDNEYQLCFVEDNYYCDDFSFQEEVDNDDTAYKVNTEEDIVIDSFGDQS